MKSIKVIFLLLAVLFTGDIAARVTTFEFDNAEQQEAYNDLVQELRCLVCQNQNIADSNAELAQDLKRKTYELIVSGKSKSEIADYMTERYGDFVLYRPPVTQATLLLWIGPFIIMFIGLFVLIRIVRSRRKSSQVEPLTEEQRSKAEELLNKQ